MVKRFDFETDDDTGESSVVERSYGDYVEYDDYDTLHEEVERLRALIKDATENVKDALSNLTDA